MIAAFDRAAVRRIGETDSRLLDLVMPRLSRLANRGLLWIGVASVLRATGDRWARRAPWRGLAAASAVTNILGKSLTARDAHTTRFPEPGSSTGLPGPPRSRPGTPRLRPPSPLAWRWRSQASPRPSSSPLRPWERRGWSPGCIIRPKSSPGSRSARPPGALTLRWWPRRPPVPAAAISPPRGAPAVPSGEDLVLAVNRSAGTTSAKLVRRLRAERLLDRIDAPHLARVRAARAAARERAWEAGAAPERGGELRIDFDATISIAHRTGTERGAHLEEDVRPVD